MITFSRLTQLIVLTVGLAALANTAEAACASPVGNEGEIKYASNAKVMVFCNGTDWISMAGWSPGSGGGGANSLSGLSDVSTTGATTGSILSYNGASWVISSTAAAGMSRLASLTDVTITNLAGRDYLRYDNATSKWVNISESAVMSTTTMVSGWPDAIACTGPTANVFLYLTADDPINNSVLYEATYSALAGTRMYVTFTKSTKSYNSHSSLGSYDCVTGTKSIATLYAEGKAFNFIGNANTSGGALGDRITSGTLAIVANSDTSYVSLSTAGTTWGYLGNAGSFLPTVTANKVSSTNVSSTYLQLSSPTTVLTCNAGLTGSMRYTSGTMQVCDGNNWGNIGIGVPTGTIAAFAASSCPAGWSEYTAARGRFLRGIDTLAAGVDPDGTRSAGGIQSDLVGPHTHSVTMPTIMSGGAANNPGDNIGGAPSIFATNGGAGYTGVNARTTTSNGTTETRPKNVAVTFCVYSGFQSAPGQTILTTLASLTDVSVGGATTGQVLAYNGTNWVASTTATASNAQGDRITSGTHVMTINTASGYVSLSANSNSSNWGYLGSGASYLPTLRSANISASSAIQVGSNSLTCSSGISGTIRYSQVSSTLEYCNSTAWVSMGPSDTVPVSFHVSKGGANQTVTAGVAATLTWNTEVFDTNNNFSSNRFTPTIRGKYLLTLNVYCETSTQACNAVIVKNGATVIGNSQVTGNNQMVAVTVIADMNGTTDYVEAVATNYGGTVISGGVAYTHFSGAIIGSQGSAGGSDRIVSGSTVVSIAADGAVMASGTNVSVQLRPSASGIANMVIGAGRAGNGFSYIDFVGDTTYTGYGLRVIRDGTGPNAPSAIQHRGTGPLQIYAVDSAEVRLGTMNSPRITIASTGGVTFNAYGAGTLTTNASGVITTSSDERLKDIQGGYTRGLADLTKIHPITYRWTKKSGLDDGHPYSGFSAQNVQKAIPEAVGLGKDGYLTLSDRPILAASVNAIKELKAENDNHLKRTRSLEVELKTANDNDLMLRAEIDQLRRELRELKTVIK